MCRQPLIEPSDCSWIVAGFTRSDGGFQRISGRSVKSGGWCRRLTDAGFNLLQGGTGVPILTRQQDDLLGVIRLPCLQQTVGIACPKLFNLWIDLQCHLEKWQCRFRLANANGENAEVMVGIGMRGCHIQDGAV